MTSVSYHIVTKSDARFYFGLKALLASLSCFPDKHLLASLTIIDAGLGDGQRQSVCEFCSNANLPFTLLDCSIPFEVRESEQHKYSAANFAICLYQFEHGRGPLDVFVHLDADTVVCGSLTSLVSLAQQHGFSAVPDLPMLDLAFQVGKESLKEQLCVANPELRFDQPAFNAGVFATTSLHWAKVLQAISQFIPYYQDFYTNDQALLNLACATISPNTPFVNAGREFNTRAHYRRATHILPPRIVTTASSSIVLDQEQNEISIVHYCGPNKPWDLMTGEPIQSAHAYDIWSYYAEKFDSRN